MPDMRCTHTAASQAIYHMVHDYDFQDRMTCVPLYEDMGVRANCYSHDPYSLGSVVVYTQHTQQPYERTDKIINTKTQSLQQKSCCEHCGSFEGKKTQTTNIFRKEAADTAPLYRANATDRGRMPSKQARQKSRYHEAAYECEPPTHSHPLRRTASQNGPSYSRSRTRTALPSLTEHVARTPPHVVQAAPIEATGADFTPDSALETSTGTVSGRKLKRRERACHPLRYKTMMCKFYESGNPCPYADKCAFAHGEAEISAHTHEDPI